VAISVRPETAASSFGTPGSTQAIVVPSTVIAGDIIAAFWHAEDGLVRIRGLAHGHPYTAWVEAGWLDIHDPAEVE
jgi:hypothetical protein